MPKIKITKSAPALDMTPMVDLAFLLVTFFMLTAKFRVNEAVAVVTPSSHSQKILPENVMQVTVDTAGRAFFALDGQEVRRAMLAEMADKYKLQVTEADAKRFSVMGEFGVPVDKLVTYIRGDEKARLKLDQESGGIPMDSVNNQLGDWIFFGWNEKQRFQQTNDIPKDNWCRISIKADGRTDYKIIKRVIQVFQDRNLNSFHLITDMETEKVQ